MSHNTLIIDPLGPLIGILVGVSAPRREALVQAGLPIPAPVHALLLIDTGASVTVIDKTVITQLGLSPTGTIEVHTPSTDHTPHSCNSYDVALFFPGSGSTRGFETLPIMEASFAAQGIQGLIGRDILAHAHMTYLGEDNIVSLTFP